MAVRHAGKADRADGMGSGFISRSDDVPDPCPGPSGRADRPGRPWVYRVFVGPAGTLVPTWSGETIRVRDRVSFQGKERPD